MPTMSQDAVISAGQCWWHEVKREAATIPTNLVGRSYPPDLLTKFAESF